MQIERIVLLNKTLPELEDIVAKLGAPKFRAKQIADWLMRGVSSIDAMKNLPADFRTKLSEIAQPLPCTIARTLISSDTSTTKLLLSFNSSSLASCSKVPFAGEGVDGEVGRGSGNKPVASGDSLSPLSTLHPPLLIESVLMKTRYGNSACISSQAGCAMGCKFCASTLAGLERNLTATEMLAQIHALQSLTPDRISRVVIMGSGEPLLNLENVIEFMELLNGSTKVPFAGEGVDGAAGRGSGNKVVGSAGQGGGMSYRKITLSTCGIPEGIRALTRWGKPINLALSLHAPNDTLRSEIMPINRTHPLASVFAATDEWQAATKRQLTAEYIVIGGINDTEAHAHELAELIGARDIFVNLIPYNPVAEREFNAPSNNAVHRIKDILERRKIPVAIRYERGADINSACGQLRNSAK
ncbi:MAG: radical SAM protein [Rickettsiales bacterium]|jgi:23S rRNA (adenine2503-C2)-methyltransferase|nr:radical SAM protein [Rickettsiales bacterium]